MIFFPFFFAISVELKHILYVRVTVHNLLIATSLFFPSVIQYFDSKWKHITKQIFLLHLQGTRVSSCPVLLFYRTGHFLRILPCPGAGQGGTQGRAGCPVLVDTSAPKYEVKYKRSTGRVQGVQEEYEGSIREIRTPGVALFPPWIFFKWSTPICFNFSVQAFLNQWDVQVNKHCLI